MARPRSTVMRLEAEFHGFWANRSARGQGFVMMGNGLANIVAALIVAIAIVWTGGFGGRSGPAEGDYDAWMARAVGDIRNDIVVSCGNEGPRRAASKSF
jgi:hypothetical protein